MIRTGTVFEDGVIVGDDLDTGYNVVFRQRVRIGNQVSVWSNSVIDPDSIIGDGSKVHCNCYLAQKTVVGKNVFIGPNVTMLNDRYPPRYDPNDWEPVVIEDNAVIGGGVVIAPGVNIGEGAIIGAGAIVLRDVPAGQIWVGTPAKRLR